jgi:hypothetical protein
VPVSLLCTEYVIASSVEVAAPCEFSCTWLSFVLTQTIFYYPETKNFFFAKLSYEEKNDTCSKLVKQKVCTYLRMGEKLSASAYGQATHTGKISGCCNFCGGCNYNF